MRIKHRARIKTSRSADVQMREKWRQRCCRNNARTTATNALLVNKTRSACSHAFAAQNVIFICLSTSGIYFLFGDTSHCENVNHKLSSLAFKFNQNSDNRLANVETRRQKIGAPWGRGWPRFRREERRGGGALSLRQFSICRSAFRETIALNQSPPTCVSCNASQLQPPLLFTQQWQQAPSMQDVFLDYYAHETSTK